MATDITTRAGKGSALTHAELDANFNNLKATADSAAASTWSFRNRLINGAFAIDQEVKTVAGDDVYARDGWYILTETGNVNLSTLANVENGTPTMLRLTQPDVTGKRIGIAQIIESSDCIDLRGQTVTFRMNRLRCSSSQAIRWAILEWTGTADTVTSDVVLSWTNSTFTAGQFFLASNVVVAATGAMTPSANTLTTGTALTATISGNCNNLIVMVWTEAVLAQNGTLDLSKAQLEPSATPTSFEVRDDELRRCMKSWEKTYDLSVAPGTATLSGSLIACSPSTVVTATNIPWVFKVVKRAPPTITIYNPSTGGTGTMRRSDDAAISAAATSIGQNGTVINNSAVTTSPANHYVHAVADARL